MASNGLLTSHSDIKLAALGYSQIALTNLQWPRMAEWPAGITSWHKRWQLKSSATTTRAHTVASNSGRPTMQQHEEAEESPTSGERHMQALVGVEVEEPTFPLPLRVQVREPLVNNTNEQRRIYLRYLNRMTQTTWNCILQQPRFACRWLTGPE